MHGSKQDLPATVEAGGVVIREAEWGEMNVSLESMPAGTETAFLFKGLPDDRCQSPHWGYVVSGRLMFRYADREETFVAGDAYTIADMASYPWIESHAAQEGLQGFPNVQRWHDAIQARPATKRVYARGDKISPPGRKLTDEARRHLFGHGKAA